MHSYRPAVTMSALAVFVATTGLAGCGTASMTVAGDLRVSNRSDQWCQPIDAFGDVQPSGNISVIADGKTLAVGRLDGGTIDYGKRNGAPYLDCIYTFKIDNVPSDAVVYTLSVGNRTSPTYTGDDLRQGVHMELVHG